MYKYLKGQALLRGAQGQAQRPRPQPGAQEVPSAPQEALLGWAGAGALARAARGADDLLAHTAASNTSWPSMRQCRVCLSEGSHMEGGQKGFVWREELAPSVWQAGLSPQEGSS